MVICTLKCAVHSRVEPCVRAKTDMSIIDTVLIVINNYVFSHLWYHISVEEFNVSRRRHMVHNNFSPIYLVHPVDRKVSRSVFNLILDVRTESKSAERNVQRFGVIN